MAKTAWTLAEAKAALKERQVNLYGRNAYGEYRVNVMGGTEATAYYSADLVDAFYTGLAMAERGSESRDEQHGRYLDCGPAAWDDR